MSSNGMYQPLPAEDEEVAKERASTSQRVSCHLPPEPRPGGVLRFSRHRWWVCLVAAGMLLVSIVAIPSRVSREIHHSISQNLGGGSSCPCAPDPNLPDYFHRTPHFEGPTGTGDAPFLAQTGSFVAVGPTYTPNEPLVTSLPIEGQKPGDPSIFHNMGHLSPYRPSDGFGVDEYPLPRGAELLQVQVMQRHGARFPTLDAPCAAFAQRIEEASPTFLAKDKLAFLNNWKSGLGHNILVPKGRQELFSSGVWHAYMYGQLHKPGTRFVARTTTQDRMLKSAENFLAGFFGLDWPEHALLEVIIEHPGYNNSLAAHQACPNALKIDYLLGYDAQRTWYHRYLANATERIGSMIQGYAWTVEDSWAAQQMCSYETVAVGYSPFCELFTYEEWRDYGYAMDIQFAGKAGFLGPLARAVGLSYQQEVLARLNNHTLGYSGSLFNVTLNNNTETFPLNQSLYFDFGHDVNIIATLTAFGLRQFAEFLPETHYPGPHNMTLASIAPFGAHLDIELIETPAPLRADRSGYDEGPSTKYIHFVLNQRTIPLGVSLPECDAARVDGWCRLEDFLASQERAAELADLHHACFEDYTPIRYGEVLDGRPPPRQKD